MHEYSSQNKASQLKNLLNAEKRRTYAALTLSSFQNKKNNNKKNTYDFNW